MEIATLSVAQIFRLLFPARHFLFADRLQGDEAVLSYRSSLVFVYPDGAVVRVERPPDRPLRTLEDAWYALFEGKGLRDYDDLGVFDLGEILRDLGYVVLAGGRDFRSGTVYLVRIAPRNRPGDYAEILRLRDVTLPYAVYHGLMRASELYRKSGREVEYVVADVEPVPAESLAVPISR